MRPLPVSFSFKKIKCLIGFKSIFFRSMKNVSFLSFLEPNRRRCFHTWSCLLMKTSPTREDKRQDKMIRYATSRDKTRQHNSTRQGKAQEKTRQYRQGRYWGAGSRKDSDAQELQHVKKKNQSTATVQAWQACRKGWHTRSLTCTNGRQIHQPKLSGILWVPDSFIYISSACMPDCLR